MDAAARQPRRRHRRASVCQLDLDAVAAVVARSTRLCVMSAAERIAVKLLSLHGARVTRHHRCHGTARRTTVRLRSFLITGRRVRRQRRPRCR
jgi:hypothetical protein